MVLPLEQAAAAAVLNNVMGRLFEALGLGQAYKMLKDLEPESESLLQDLRMLAAAVDDELTGSRGARRTAVARAYSREMRALTHDVEDCIERFVHRVTGGRPEGASWLLRATHRVRTLRTCHRFAGEIKRLKKRVQEASARVLKPPEGQIPGSRRRAAPWAWTSLWRSSSRSWTWTKWRANPGLSPSLDLVAWGKLLSPGQSITPPLSSMHSLIALGLPCARRRTAMPPGFWRIYTSCFSRGSNTLNLRSPNTSRIRGIFLGVYLSWRCQNNIPISLLYPPFM